MENTNLTPHELIAVRMLAQGLAYRAIKNHLGISTFQLCPFLAALRRRTGIKNTQDPEEVKKFLEDYENAINGPGPSPLQLEIMQRHLGIGYAETHTFEGMSHKLNRPIPELYAEYQAGAKAAGVFTTDPREMRVQLRKYLATRSIVIGGAVALTDAQLWALRLYAEGFTMEGIAIEMGIKFKYAKVLIKEGVSRLGVIAQGRGVQRKLVAIALERVQRERREAAEKEAEAEQARLAQPFKGEEVTMEDPFF